MAEAVADVIVVIPGITGSTLVRRREDRRVPIWAPSPGALAAAIRTVGRSVTDLRLSDAVGDGPANDGVEAESLVPDLHVIPGLWSVDLGYSKLVSWLFKTFHLFEYDRTTAAAEQHPIPNFVRFPYDWRLSNRHNATLLKATVEPVLQAWRAQGEPFRAARLVLIGHSMGGLIARWYAEQLGGAPDVRAVVTIGTPHRGSAKALHALVNGAPAKLGPIGANLTAALRSFPSLYELLPAYRCVLDGGKRHAPHETALPHLDPDRARAAREDFHDRLHPNPTRQSAGYDLHTIVGVRQPTRTTATRDQDRLIFVNTIDDEDRGGDGTVPRIAATPPDVLLDAPSIVGVSEQHGSLQHHPHTFEQLYTVLTGTDRVYLDDDALTPRLGLTLPSAHVTGEPVRVRVTATSDNVRLRATVFGEDDEPAASRLLLREAPATFAASFDGLPTGGYRIVVDRDGPSSNRVSPVTGGTLVWDPLDGGADGS